MELLINEQLSAREREREGEKERERKGKIAHGSRSFSAERRPTKKIMENVSRRTDNG